MSASRAQRADETGYLWTFLNEARDPGQIKPGAIIVAGDQDAAAVCEVIDLAPAGDGTIVHHEFADRRDLAAAVTVWTPTSSVSFASSMGPGFCHDLGTTMAGLGEHHGVVAGGSSSLVRAGRWRWR